MKTWKFILTLVFVTFWLPMVYAQQSLEGSWTTVDDETGEKRAILLFVVKNGTLSATIEHIYAQSGDTGICDVCPGRFKDKPIKGLEVIWGLKENSAGVWDGGQILDAHMGKIYRVRVSMDGDKLLVRGYIGIPMIGRTQIWERA